MGQEKPWKKSLKCNGTLHLSLLHNSLRKSHRIQITHFEYGHSIMSSSRASSWWRVGRSEAASYSKMFPRVAGILD